MSQADRDWYREPDRRPEAWGHSRTAWVLAALAAVAWLLPGAAGRIRLDDALGLHPLEWPSRAWTLLTYAFLAPQGGTAIALACLAMLWFFARDVERDLGPGSMCATFAAGALAAGLAAAILARVTGDGGILTGGHGATSALAVRWALRRRGDDASGVPAALIAASAIVLPAAARFFEADDRLAIAWTAGALSGWVLERVAARGERAALKVAAAVPEPPGEAPPPGPPSGTRRRVDALLAKIQAEGIEALTKEEREFLSQASREFRDGRGGE